MRHRNLFGRDRGESGPRRHGRRSRLGIAIALAGACGLLAASSAAAQTVTVGSVLPLTFTSTPFGQVETQLNTALPERGANLVSPVNGMIVRWRIQGGKGGPFFLRVLHPNSAGAYTAMGTSGPATPTTTGLQTFNANLPVHAGDLIGIDPTNAGDEIGVASVAGASTAFVFPPPFDGSTVAPTGTGPGKEIELSAEVQATPEITSLSPRSGSISGGAKVTITGRSFLGATAVKFGTKPVTSFTVDSDTQITATAPAATAPGRVDVAVTSVAGTNPTVRADRFTYTACVVPKLKGKGLKAGTAALKRAGCRLGKVKGPKSKLAKVAHQSPSPGKVLPPGAKVNVRLAG